MLCINNSEDQPNGFVRVDVSEVIKSCEDTIAHLDRLRRKRSRKHIRETFINQRRKWQRYWRWFGSEPPTRQTAFQEYRYDDNGWYPQWLSDEIIYGAQYETCEDVLRAAKAAKRSTMWVSDQTVRSICL